MYTGKRGRLRKRKLRHWVQEPINGKELPLTMMCREKYRPLSLSDNMTGRPKKAFMGGDVIQATSKDVGWKRALDKVIINKALFCLTDDDVWFIFPKCRIVSREANTDKAIAIAVKGLVQEPGIEGVSSEYNYEEGQIKALQA